MEVMIIPTKCPQLGGGADLEFRSTFIPRNVCKCGILRADFEMKQERCKCGRPIYHSSRFAPTKIS